MRNKWAYKLASLSEADKVWLAAAIDFEGCIYVGEAQSHRSPANHPSFRARISVGVTDKILIDRITQLTNNLGNIYHRVRKNGHLAYRQYKDVWQWSICDIQVDAFLDVIYPYLVAKKRQADLVRAFRSDVKEFRTCANRILPEERIKERRLMCDTLKKLR